MKRIRLAEIFVSIHNPRQQGKERHDLMGLLILAVNAMLAWQPATPPPMNGWECSSGFATWTG